MAAVNFWTCSKQSHKGRRGGWLLKGGSKEAEGRHKHCRGCRMEAQWSPNANGRQVIDAFCCKFSRQSGRCFCLPCRWSSYTETGFSWVRRPLSVLAIFWSFKGGTKVVILCKATKGGIRLCLQECGSASHYVYSKYAGSWNHSKKSEDLYYLIN